MKFKISIMIVGMIFLSSISQAQYLVNQGADIVFNSGTSLVIKGNFTNLQDGSIDNSGQIRINGNWYNNQTSGALLFGTTGDVVCNGSVPQVIGGSANTHFYNLDLQNDVNMGYSFFVYGKLFFNNTFFTLGNHVLQMVSGSLIVGANNNGYIVTNSAGILMQYVNSANITFPIGTASAYAPITLNNTGGTADYYSARAFGDVLANGTSGSTIADIADCVDMTWVIDENSVGGSDLDITTFWGAALEGGNFDRTHAAIGNYSGGSWDPDFESTAAGANPYSISRTNVSSLGAFAVGDLESPMALPLDLRIDLKAFLEGPFNGTDMDNTLNAAGLLPLNQPFNSAPINYSGSESVPAIPNANIIDWVLVELRDATSAANATPSTIVERKALFLRNDGKVVALDGSSVPSFSSTIINNLYVVVRHRNHVAIMSANALTPSGGIFSYNFSNAVGKVYGGANGHKQIAAGSWGMFSGNGYPDDFIIIQDKDFVWAPEAGETGYLNGDFDMDSHVDNVDKNDHWVENTGETSQVPN